MPGSEPAARHIYLHIPFCRSRCPYCAFTSWASREAQMPAYVAALEREIACAASWWARQGGPPVESVFLGGGTPSCLPPAMLERVLKVLRRDFALAADCEITLEANPGDVSAERASAWRRMGFNRISIGAQAADEKMLRWLGRRHDWARVQRAVQEARAAGFSNLNLDLIYGLPGLTLDAWRRTLQAALELGPDHLSLYPLSIEEGTPLARCVAEGRVPPAAEEAVAEQYELACELLAAHGLRHYEISNWAKDRRPRGPVKPAPLPDFACRHNVAVWRNQTYFGLGAGAHGYLAGWRYANPADLGAYLRAVEGLRPESGLFSLAAWSRRVDRREAMENSLLLRLRLLEAGVSPAEFAARHGVSLAAALGPRLQELLQAGWLEMTEDALRLRPKAWLVANRVLGELLTELQVPTQDGGPQAGRSK